MLHLLVESTKVKKIIKCCKYVKQLFIFAAAKNESFLIKSGEVGEWLNPPVC